jgi:hypothetical protein
MNVVSQFIITFFCCKDIGSHEMKCTWNTRDIQVVKAFLFILGFTKIMQSVYVILISEFEMGWMH